MYFLTQVFPLPSMSILANWWNEGEKTGRGQRWGSIRCSTQSHWNSRVIRKVPSKQAGGIYDQSQINILSSSFGGWRCTGSDEQKQNMLNIVGGVTWQKSWPDKPYIFAEHDLIVATTACNYLRDRKEGWAPTTVSGLCKASHFQKGAMTPVSS